MLSQYLTRAALVASLGLSLAAPAAMASAQDRGEAAARGERARGDRADCDHRGKRGRHHGRAAHFRKDLRQLELTANQKAQVRAIMEDARERRQELRSQGRSEEARQARQTLRTETRRLILEVLTPAQRTELGELQEARRERKRARKLERMAERLELTDEQVATVRALFDQADAQRDRIRTSTEDPEARHRAMRQVREETRAAVLEVLTPEQRQEMKTHHDRKKGKRGHGRRGRR